MPLAFDGTLLVEVVTLLEMSLGVSLPTGHCANREHSPTLVLFENQDQVGQCSGLDERTPVCGDNVSKVQALVNPWYYCERTRSTSN